MARRRRSTTPRGDKLLTGPPPERDIRPVIATIPAGTGLLRIYAPASHGAGPLTFRRFGPLGRFDHQRGDGGPRLDRPRGILYAGSTLVCCVGEFFGDQGSITRAGNRLARLVVKKPLATLDLRGRAATGAGTIAAIGGVGERATTQAWARWWYEQPQLAEVAGLLYKSAQTGDDALALWERAKGSLGVSEDWGLDDPEIRDDLELAAYALSLPLF
ncbi:MAG: RES family NAD+ phosphorylase [Thermoleophilaceae bacterium]